MENSYGVGITNRYSCFSFLCDDDTGEIRPQEVEQQKKGSTATAGRKGLRDSNQKGNEAVKTANRTSHAAGTGDNGNKRIRGPRNDRSATDRDRSVKFNEEEREERNNKWNREHYSRDIRSSDSDYNSYSSGSRGGFRGDRRGGSRGGRGGGGFRKREFDRQSGSEKSGVKPIEKREGAGSRNWGTYRDDLEEENTENQTGGEESSEDKTWDIEPTEDRETVEEQENQTDSPNEPIEEEQPKLMTLDEWKALQQPRQKPVFNLRKPGEGEDPSQWQKMELIKKEKEGEEEEDEEEEEEYDHPQRAGRQKQVLEVDFHFTDSRRGGSGNERRGGRGGRGHGGLSPRKASRGRGDGPGTGRGFRGGFRGGRGGRDDPPRNAAPRVDDVDDFPSLMG